MSLTKFMEISDAICLLFNPLVEVVIHDLSSGNICYKNGLLSRRKVGDKSMLNLGELNKDLAKTIYPKINFEGKLIKSVSIPMDNSYLICINCDITIFENMMKVSSIFTNVTSKSFPENLFKDEWQDKIQYEIHEYISKKSWKFDKLTAINKNEIIKHLSNITDLADPETHKYIAKALVMDIDSVKSQIQHQ